MTGLLAEGVVHYALWSPGSTRLAFIALTSKGLSLFLDDLRDSVGAAVVLDRGPLWTSWSPDSQYLPVHRGATHFLVNTLEGIRVDELAIRAVGYRVPAWKPPGAIVTIASGDGPGRYTILSAQVVGDDLDVMQPVTSLHEIGFPLTPAFLWSPNGKLLALAGSARVVIYLGLPVSVYRDLDLFSEGEAAQTILIQDNVIAYFWSPDGSRLAYVAPSQTAGVLRWTVLNVVNGERWPLVDFIPSRDQLVMFQFFDQYAYSHSPWSPDSRSLVFAGELTDRPTMASATSGVARGVARQGSRIIVVGTDPEPSAQTIADGILGFWSPQQDQGCSSNAGPRRYGLPTSVIGNPDPWRARLRNLPVTPAHSEQASSLSRDSSSEAETVERITATDVAVAAPPAAMAGDDAVL